MENIEKLLKMFSDGIDRNLSVRICIYINDVEHSSSALVVEFDSFRLLDEDSSIILLTNDYNSVGEIDCEAFQFVKQYENSFVFTIKK